MTPKQWAVFTGAGISGAAPANLPLGNRLRNDVLDVLLDAVEEVTPSRLPAGLRNELAASTRKLEVVVGRLVQTVGHDGFGCLFAMHVDLPNVSHLLSACHLAHGGLHVTVNLDVGIETAYELLTGRRPLPDHAHAVYTPHLATWRRMLPASPPPLRVVALKAEFETWRADGCPPALLKIHGSLSVDQGRLLDPVVVDIDELAQLSPGRAAAIERTGGYDAFLVTGYAGEDIDCYADVLRNVDPRCQWRQFSGGDRVRPEVERRGGRFFEGDPEGLAVTGLAHALGINVLPEWPDGTTTLDRYDRLFHAWAAQLRQQHRSEDIASAGAWLLADIGQHDLAIEVLRCTAASAPSPAQQVRLASILYERAAGDDRDEAARLFRQLARNREVPRGLRLHSLLRVGGVARGRMATGQHSAAVVAAAAPIVTLIVTQGGKTEPEAAAAAYGALQQLALRVGERLAAVTPTAGRRPLAASLRASTLLAQPATRLTTNGNAAGLIQQHRLALLCLASLLRHQPTPPDVLGELEALRRSYEHGDDLPAVGNCLVTRAIAHIAEHDTASAQDCLAEARRCYARSRLGPPNPAGMAFAAVAERLLHRFA